MDDDTTIKNTIELELRRLIAQDVGQKLSAYRTHLESQFNFLKTSISVIAAAAAVVLVFFLGRSWLEMSDAIQGKVDAVFAEHAVETRLTQKELATTESKAVVAAIDKAVAKRGIQSLEPIIEQKRQELSQVNAATLFADLPVGTIIASTLTASGMATASGGRWVPADGRDVSGTPYATLTGTNTIPDLRGLFLRGINAGSGLATDYSHRVTSFR